MILGSFITWAPEGYTYPERSPQEVWKIKINLKKKVSRENF
jgi:hypothetical protein